MAGGYNIQSEVNRSQAIINKVYKDKRYPPDGAKFPNTKDGRLAFQFAKNEYARVKAERAKQGETRANPEFQGTVHDQTYFQGEWHNTKELNKRQKKQLAIGPTADTTSGSIESQGKAQDKVIADFQRQQRAAENLKISNEYRANVAKNPWAIENLPGREIARSKASSQGGFVSSNLSITKGADGSTQVVKTPPSIIPAEATTEKTTTNTPSYSTDVFTIDPATGEAVGVLTRNQRKNFEARADVQKSLAAWHADPKNKLRIYKNKGGMMGKYEYSAGG